MEEGKENSFSADSWYLEGEGEHKDGEGKDVLVNKIQLNSGRMEFFARVPH